VSSHPPQLSGTTGRTSISSLGDRFPQTSQASTPATDITARYNAVSSVISAIS
jgi:hypothetical protein